MRRLCLLFLAVGLAGCKTSQTTSTSISSPVSLAAFQEQAVKFRSVVALPDFETTPEAVRQSTSNTIAQANAALDRIGRLTPGEVNFRNTILALDDAMYPASCAAGRLDLIKETSTNGAVRDAATEAVKILEEWSVGLDYREDVYRAVKAFADTKPALSGEDAKLLEELLRDYRRAGLALPKAERDEVERLRKELANLETDFRQNITKTQKPLKFTRAQFEGVPESLLNSPGVKTGDDEFTVMANVTFHALAVLENAKREDVRKQMETERASLAKDVNAPLLQRIVELRDRIARKLGYASWADFQIEPRMAKDGRTAREFLRNMRRGLQPKFEAEKAELRALKVRETGDPNAEINLWDWRYFAAMLQRERYAFDDEELRVYFPYERVLDGMFAVYQRIFGLKFAPVDPPYKWIGDLQLYAVSDAKTGEPMGLFYLDMFPREGKYNHFAVFSIIEGKQLPDRRYQRPTCAMICNFPPPEPGKPSLMSFSDVETLFHEFGHVMHYLLTRAKTARFSGANVERDFVEAPSQMLENWARDKAVLDSFAADYRDPSKKIPTETLRQLKAAKLAVEGNRYCRQFSFGLTDLALHSDVRDGSGEDVVKLSNKVLGEVFVAYFGHLVGYDAGYYGYAWADAIAADMATVFEKAPRRFFDTSAGRRLREEVYAVGGARDANESIRNFLGRERSIEPFLKSIGIGNATK
jgi:thimet oligopeptidase